MVECYKCGFWDYEYQACTRTNADKLYACSIEDKKQENIKASKESAELDEVTAWIPLPKPYKGEDRRKIV